MAIFLFPTAVRRRGDVSGDLVPLTSLSRPPWPEQKILFTEEEERSRHAAVVSTVNQQISQKDFGRLFAVVHFASRQWKVTDEDLIMIENHIEAECGERIRMEKVLIFKHKTLLNICNSSKISIDIKGILFY